MAKFTYEDKKEIIRLYDEEHYGYPTIAKKYNVRVTTISRIVRRYKLHGESSLIKQKNRKFPADLKFEIISRAMNGESKKSLGIKYMIQEAQIILWLKKYEEFGYNGLIDKPKGRPPDMKKEKKAIDPNDKDAVIKSQADRILELEAEVEALKKLRALVLQRNEQQTKKKQ
jgi:transposase